MKTIQILAGILLLGILFSCSSEPPSTPEESVKIANVNTKKLVPRSFDRFIKLIGTVEAGNDVQISAEVSGRIKEYYVERGGEVKKGDPILKIEDQKLRSEKDRLEARLEQTKEQYERRKRIFEEDSVGSEIDIINARSEYLQSRSALESVKVDLNNTLVMAPFDATLEERFLETGERAGPGTPLVRLIGSNQLKVTAGVPARYAEVVQTGDHIKLWFDTQNPDTLTAEIVYVAKSIDPQNRTFKIEVALPKDHSYKVDMVANLRLTTLSRNNVIVVSEEFIYKKDDEFNAYVLERDDNGNPVAGRRKVILGPSFGSEIIVKEGLQSGDELITVGSAFLKEGMRLNILKRENENLVIQ